MFFLIRHGATPHNLARPRRLQGKGVDGGLSEIGRRQAEATARFLAEFPLRAVYASPLRRARETAELIAGAHGMAVLPAPELAEVDVGRWEGRDWDDIARNEPDDYARFLENPGLHGYPEGENLTQVQARVSGPLRRLLEEHAEEHVAVVAHNVVNRAFLAGVLGLPLAGIATLAQDNCCVNVLRRRDSRVELRTLNATFHLREVEHRA